MPEIVKILLDNGANLDYPKVKPAKEDPECSAREYLKLQAEKWQTNEKYGPDAKKIVLDAIEKTTEVIKKHDAANIVLNRITRSY